MKWVWLGLVVAIANCSDSSGPAGLNIRAEGHVKLSSNGAPVVGALITVRRLDAQVDATPVATAETNQQGFYSVAYNTGGPCEPFEAIPSPFSMSVSSPGLLAPVIIGFPECTEAIQTHDIDMQPSALPDRMQL